MSGDTHQEHLRERARQQLTPARVGTDVGLSALLGFILYRTVKKSPVVKIAKATTELVHKPQALSIVKNVGKIGASLLSIRNLKLLKLGAVGGTLGTWLVRRSTPYLQMAGLKRDERPVTVPALKSSPTDGTA